MAYLHAKENMSDIDRIMSQYNLRDYIYVKDIQMGATSYNNTSDSTHEEEPSDIPDIEPYIKKIDNGYMVLHDFKALTYILNKVNCHTMTKEPNWHMTSARILYISSIDRIYIENDILVIHEEYESWDDDDSWAIEVIWENEDDALENYKGSVDEKKTREENLHHISDTLQKDMVKKQDNMLNKLEHGRIRFYTVTKHYETLHKYLNAQNITLPYAFQYSVLKYMAGLPYEITMSEVYEFIHSKTARTSERKEHTIHTVKEYVLRF